MERRRETERGKGLRFEPWELQNSEVSLVRSFRGSSRNTQTYWPREEGFLESPGDHQVICYRKFLWDKVRKWTIIFIKINSILMGR